MASMRSVGVRLRMFVDRYKQDAAEAAKATEQVGKAGKKSKADMDQFAGALTVVGGLLVAAAGVAIVATAKFDKQMSEVGAVANATGEDLERLRDAAIEAGQATSFSASEAAQAQAELAKAGIATADILSGGLSGALSLAAAGSLELATAAEIAAAAMNTFDLEGRDVGHIADVLAAAANKSAAGVEDLGLGLQQVGLVAAQVGFSLEETVGLLAAFADRGLRGSDGATSLKTALLRLAAPVGDAADLMKTLGISLDDSNGNMVDAVTIAGQLETGMADLSAAERNAALNTIFGADAIRAANVLYGLGADGVREYIEAVDDQGAASDVAAAKLDNLAGDAEALGGSLETLFIKSGEGATGPLRFLTQQATGLVNTFSELPGPVQAAGLGIAGITGLSALGAAGFVKFKTGLAETVENLGKMGPAGARAGRGLQTVVTWGGRAAGALAGLIVYMQIAEAVSGDDLNPQIEALAEGLERVAEGGEASGELSRLFGEDMQFLDSALQKSSSSMSGFLQGVEKYLVAPKDMNDSYRAAAERVTALDTALANMVSGGNAVGAGEIWSMLEERAAALGIPIEELKKLFPEYAAAMEVAGDATGEQADEAAAAERNNIALAGAFGEAANEAGGLKKAFDVLNGAMLTWRGAERDAEAAVDDLEAALVESNGSLDIHDEKGRAAAAAVDALAQGAIDAAQAKYDETGSVEEANRVYEDYIGQLRQVLLNAGYSEEAVNQLIGEIAAVPTYKAIQFDVNVRMKGFGDFGGLQNQLLGLLSSVGASFRWGGIQHAASGLLRQATIASRPMISWAEPETGGEAFVPFKGNYSRSMSIMSTVADKYNADVVPRGTWSSGGGSAVDVRVSLAPGADGPIGRAIQEMIRVDVVNVAGGSVQGRYGQRGRY